MMFYSDNILVVILIQKMLFYFIFFFSYIFIFLRICILNFRLFQFMKQYYVCIFFNTLSNLAFKREIGCLVVSNSFVVLSVVVLGLFFYSDISILSSKYCMYIYFDDLLYNVPLKNVVNIVQYIDKICKYLCILDAK